MFRRKKPPCPPHNQDEDCAKVAYRMNHHKSVADNRYYTIIWDNCLGGGLIGVTVADTLQACKDEAVIIMDEWDIRKVTRASNG